MSEFDDAVKRLGIPRCTHCGELRQIERQNSLVWWCAVCSKTFIVPKVAKP